MLSLSVARLNLLTAAAVTGALGLGVAVVVAPPLALGAAAVWGTVMLLAPSRTRLPGLYLGVLGGLLAGYLLFGRGFAYLGVGAVLPGLPVSTLFVGDLVLALGILAFALRPPRAQPLSPGAAALAGLVGLFMLWSLVATVPYLGRYGLAALRDAALWGYAAFALPVMTFLDSRGRLERCLGWFRTLIPAFLVWVVLAELLRSVPGRVPMVDDGVPLIDLKPGDVGVHLAGVGAFMMLGLHRPSDAGARGWRRGWIEALVWVGWSIDFALVAARNRGGGLAVLAALAAVALAARAWPLLKPVSAVALVLLAVTALNLRIGQVNGREVSVSQVTANFSSIVEGNARPELYATRRWRLAWWRRIVDYTVHGRYFWTGKGYGVNLADDDGFQVTADHSLRSPHNVNLTVLARSGVPGLVLWLVLQAGFAGRLLVVGQRARRLGERRGAAICTLILAYWVAMQCNAAFDVYLEGPQGGIWFWAILGAGLAVGTTAGAPAAGRRAREAVA